MLCINSVLFIQKIDFFQYVDGPLADGLYWEQYYNNANVSSDDMGYIYFENKVLGMPRIRQIRVRNDSCE